MKTGTWFAYCDRQRLISLDELARRLSSDDEISLRQDRENLLVVMVHDSLTGNDADITVTIDTGPHVAVEAAELYDRNLPLEPGIPPIDRNALRRAEARYELTWLLKFSDETYNPMLMMAGELMQACGAIVFDLTNTRFV